MPITVISVRPPQVRSEANLSHQITTYVYLGIKLPLQLPLQLPLLNYHLSITAYYSQTQEVNCQCYQTLRSNEVFISTLPHDRLHGPPCVSYFLSISQLNPKTEALMKSIKTSSTTHELYTFAIMVC